MNDRAQAYSSRALRDILCNIQQERVQRSEMNRVKAGFESHEGHFERLLQMYSASDNSQINASLLVLIWTLLLTLSYGTPVQFFRALL
jgi:hypothetical protein